MDTSAEEYVGTEEPWNKPTVPVDGLAVLSQGTQQFESIDRYWVWFQKQRLIPKE